MQTVQRQLRRACALALICAVSATSAVAESTAASNKSVVPGYPDVIGEYLQIAGEPTSGTPKEFSTATFLRLRSTVDGATPKPANAVIVAMPGFASTPSHWLYLASQLVHKASERTCEGNPCRLEVWVVQRRGANLAETQGGRQARAKNDPNLAIDYYFSRSVLSMDTKRPGKWPVLPPAQLIGAGGAKFRPLQQEDLRFMSEWGFEAYAGDVDRMIKLVRQGAKTKNVFLAGHSQGGGFVANYAGRLQSDGKRGYEKLAGLIFLDGGPSAGNSDSAGADNIKEYFERVAKLRGGEAKVYTDESGALGDLAGPAAAAAAVVTNAHYAMVDPESESIFGPRGVRRTSVSPAGDDFLGAIRLTYRARAGLSFDTDPLPGRGNLQVPILTRLGEGLGNLDFKPRAGTEDQCDAAKTAPPCVPTAEQLDPDKVYGWIEGGGSGGAPTKAGKALLWMQSQAYAPARSNIKPITFEFAKSGMKTLDASNMVASNWYPSERYDGDMQFWGRFKTIKVAEQGVSMDIDKTAITHIGVYVARQSPAATFGNPFPKVTDFTEVNKAGTHQTPQAMELTPFDKNINSALYFHTDYVSVDDSLAGKVTPGQPGSSAVANTLIEWVLKRSVGRAKVPTPKELGVVERY
jgi:pimeloyl-ACP methyl ester carboxylesterase